MPQYGEGFWFVIKAHSSLHIEICAGGCNAEGGPKDQEDVELFFAEALLRRWERSGSQRALSFIDTAGLRGSKLY